MSFKDFYLSNDLPGIYIIRPFGLYHEFCQEKASQNKNWLALHVITGIVVYPLAAVASLFSLLLNLLAFPYLCYQNQKRIQQCQKICENIMVVHRSTREDVGAQITFHYMENGSQKDIYMGASSNSTSEERNQLYQRLNNLVWRHYTRQFVGVIHIDISRYGGTYNEKRF